MHITFGHLSKIGVFMSRIDNCLRCIRVKTINVLRDEQLACFIVNFIIFTKQMSKSGSKFVIANLIGGSPNNDQRHFFVNALIQGVQQRCNVCFPL
jgi:hypothetical protein